MKIFKTLAALCATATLVLSMQPAMTGDGHDHGEKTTPETSAVTPRFAAVSESFEMVGVINGKQVTIYLDRFADNSPVKDARIELELGEVKINATAHDDDDGEYEATLPNELNQGVIPVVATVTVGQDSDLLTGELDLHDAKPAKDAGKARTRITAWPLILLVPVLLGWGAWRLRSHHKKIARNKSSGDAV